MSDELRELRGLVDARWGPEGNAILQIYIRSLRGNTPEKMFAHLEDLWTRNFPDAIARKANDEIARQFVEEKKAIDAACAAEIDQLQKEFEQRKAECEARRKAEIAAKQQNGRTQRVKVIKDQIQRSIPVCE